MDSDYTSILKLDEDFKNGLEIINPFIPGLRTQNYVRLCRMWIDKLIHCAPHERQLRNIYLEQLCRHSQQHVLGTPFNCPPNEGPLQTIPQQYLIRQGVSLSKHQAPPARNGETTSWSDVSDVTSCISGSTWQPEECEENCTRNLPVIVAPSSIASTTDAETACTESTNHIRFKHHSKSSTQSNIKRKKPKKIKKQTCLDSNDELFKDCYESPVRSKSVASRRKVVKKIKRAPRVENCVKTSEYSKGESRSSCKLTRKRVVIKSKNSEEDNVEEAEEEEEIVDENSDEGHEEKEKENKLHSRKRSSEMDSKDTVVEMYNHSMNPLQNEDNEKIIELESKISVLRNENQAILEQLITEKDKKDDLNHQLGSLKNEVNSLKDKLMLVEKMKNALECEHQEIVHGVSESLSDLTTRVDNAIDKNDKVEIILTKLNNEAENTIQSLKKEMAAKCKALEHEYEEKISDLKKCHTQIVQNYENCISKLKKDISNKNKDKVKLEKKLQEKCGEMRTEVENIKRDMERSSKENEIQLNARINAYKTKVFKLLKYNQKATEFYEQKINALNKTKDMELWVQKLNVGSAFTNDRKQELESIVSSLEEKFRKQLNDATRRTFDHNEQKLKYEEIASELGSEKGNKSGSDTSTANIVKNKDANKIDLESK